MSMDRKIEKKKGLRLKHIIYIVAGLAFIALIVKIVTDSNTSVYKVEADKISIEEVQYGQFNDYTKVNGVVQPISIIFLDAIEGGRIEERFIEEGTMVKKGDVILRLENRQLYQTILNSEAALAEKENYLRNTRISFEIELINSKKNLLDNKYRLTRKKRTFEQYEKLYKDDLISKEDYLISKEDYEYEVGLLEINELKAKNDSLIRATSMITLQEDLEKMRETLQLVHERLENLNVKAPVDGQLGMLDAEIGQLVSSGNRIGQINVLTNYKVEGLIDEHYIDRVRAGLSATFERNDQKHAMVVKKVYPEVREGQFQIDMVFKDELPEKIRTGQTYYVDLELGQPQTGIIIPKGAFFQSTGGQWIYVMDPSGTFAVKRNIRIGRQNPQYYEVLEGLEKGEKVVTSSYDLFGDNDKLVLK